MAKVLGKKEVEPEGPGMSEIALEIMFRLFGLSLLFMALMFNIYIWTRS